MLNITDGKFRESFYNYYQQKIVQDSFPTLRKTINVTHSMSYNEKNLTMNKTLNDDSTYRLPKTVHISSGEPFTIVWV